MFLQSKKYTYLSFTKVSQVLHFLRLHQVVYQLTLVITILFFGQPVNPFELISALLLIVLITPTFLLVQDLLGKQDDEKVNQKRIIFSQRFNKIFFFSSLTVMIIILLLNNNESVICYILLFFSTLGYAAAKHYRKMFLSYAGRYLSSVFTILVYIFILTNVLNSNIISFILFVSILDLVGNIAGDIRDFKKDSDAGVKTLVTIYDRTITLQLMSFIVIGLFSFLLIYYQSILLVALFLCCMIQFVIIELVPVKLSHGVFHLGKLFNFLGFAAFLTETSILIIIPLALFIIIIWSFAYYFYLFNTGISHA